jgi:ATP-dependent Lhr-like helicase
MDAIERQLQRLDPKYHVRSTDGLHDLLLGLGDLTADEIRARSVSIDLADGVETLVADRRAVGVRVAGDPRFIAVEDAARFRDALGVVLPLGLPESLLEPVRDPLGDLARRFARTRAPFTAAQFARRYGLGIAAAEAILVRLTAEGGLIEGEFRPGGTKREWTDANVLRMLRRRSLAKLRQEIEPVDQSVLGRFAPTWQGIVKPRQGPDALLDVVEQLQGAPIVASTLESDVLPARIAGYDPADLDAVTAAGEVVWVGVEPLGERDGRVALYLADHLPRLIPASTTEAPDALSGRESAIVEFLRTHGASFFAALHDAAGGGYPAETVDALWNLAWRGIATNDTFHSLRAFIRSRASKRKRHRPPAAAFRSRRMAPSSAEGRWTLVPSPSRGPATSRRSSEDTKAQTKWAAAVTEQLLARHGVVTREAAAAEDIPGGFSSVYPVLKELEERGRVRRGYFVAGLGATQFAMPGAVDLLRSLRDAPDEPEVVVLAATDPANPYGATLPWPERSTQKPLSSPNSIDANSEGSASNLRGPVRTVGAVVILVDGALVAYLARGGRQLTAFLPDDEPARSKAGRAIARVLAERASASIGDEDARGVLIEEIDGLAPSAHPLAPYLTEAGFVAGALGMAVASGQSPVGTRTLFTARRPSRRLLSSPFSPRNFVDPDGDPEH